MTTIPTITALPTPVPTTTDPANFDTRADTFLAALPTMVTQENASIVAMNTVAGEVEDFADAAEDSADTAASAATAANIAATAAAAATGYVAESVTSFSVGTGSKAFGIAAGKAFAANDEVVAIRKGDVDVRMYGTVTTYSGTTLTVNVTSFLGSGGPFTDWIILHRAFEDFAVATVAQIRSGAVGLLSVTAEMLALSAAFGTALTYGATPAWDLATNGYNTSIVLTGSSASIGAITGIFDGCPVILDVTQDGTGSRAISWNATYWDFGSAGAPTLSSGANKVDMVTGVYRSTTGKVRAYFWKAA